MPQIGYALGYAAPGLQRHIAVAETYQGLGRGVRGSSRFFISGAACALVFPAWIVRAGQVGNLSTYEMASHIMQRHVGRTLQHACDRMGCSRAIKLILRSELEHLFILETQPPLIIITTGAVLVEERPVPSRGLEDLD